MLHILHATFWAALILGSAWFLRDQGDAAVWVAVAGPFAFAISLILFSKAAS
ncbi:MAG: hypothetical protein AAFR11_01900 [Pseudomonadota bacterium]